MIRLLRKIYIKIFDFQAIKKIRKRAIIGKNVLLSHHFVFKSDATDRLVVGNNVSLDGLWVIQGKGMIKIGNYCSFRAGTYVGSSNTITIGNHVYGAENIFMIDNNNHPTSPKERIRMTMAEPNTPLWKWQNEQVISSPIIIEDNVWLGRNCMILKGVKIGEGSIIAAAAVVTKDVPPYSIVAGNPARVVKKIEKDC